MIKSNITKVWVVIHNNNQTEFHILVKANCESKWYEKTINNVPTVGLEITSLVAAVSSKEEVVNAQM